MKQSANTRGATSRARHHHVTRTAHRIARLRVDSGRGGLEASGLPRTNESMAATVIFWTADLQWQIPAASCWRTRTAGRGAYAIDQRNGNARYLVAARQMERTNLRRDHSCEPGTRRSIRGTLRTP